MAKDFNIQRARGSLPGRATQVRANLDVRTGGQQVAQAVSRLGGAMIALGEKYYNIEAQAQLDNAIMNDQDEHIRYVLGLRGIEDTSEKSGLFKKSFDDSMETRQGFMPTNKLAAQRYNTYLKRRRGAYLSDTVSIKLAKTKDNFRANGFRMQQKYIESGDPELLARYDAHLEQGQSGDIEAYTDEQAAKYRQDTIDSRERYAKIQIAQQLEQLEIQREKDRDEISKLVRSGQSADAAIEGSSLEEKEQFTWFERQRAETDRRLKGEDVVADLARKHELLDMAAAINWPERQVTAQEVKELANEGRYGPSPNLDDAAFDEVRDAIRKAEEDKIPFTQKYIENTIGEIITGAPSSVLGLPLPTLRTREDAIRHATNAFGRFVSRVPGVMDTINAKYPPEKRKSTPEEPKGTPAYDFDGELIGGYNPDGSITLNSEGVNRLYEIAGRDAKKARQMAEQNRYIIPKEK